MAKICPQKAALRRWLVGLVALVSSAAAADSRVPLPVIHITQGTHCVQPVSVMRRYHMKFLLHHRNQTVHLGIRTRRYSLKNCVDCHADPKTHSVLGKNGFCQSCHAYAAVRIDCFSCHSSAPEPGVVPTTADGSPLRSMPSVPGIATLSPAPPEATR